MRFEILRVADTRAWKAAMRRAGAHDVYYLPEYHELYSYLPARSFAYVAAGDGEVLFYPFLLRPISRIGSVEIPPGLNDIETVYGYTGPIATSGSPDFLAEAWRGFEVWCSEHTVVGEFIRFNPVLQTERFAAAQVDVQLDRETVEIRLDRTEYELWNSYQSVQRNRVRKAIKDGLICDKVKIEKGLDEFVRLYNETMQRVRASAFYFFPYDYYIFMKRKLLNYVRLFVVKHEGKTVAAALFFVYGDLIHYHLGGSTIESPHLASNNLMFHHVALWARRRGFKRLHLGGGRSNSVHDSLFRFKRRFSPDRLPFYLGRRIHDPERYNMLCDVWMEQSGCRVTGSYFRIYRLDPAASDSPF